MYVIQDGAVDIIAGTGKQKVIVSSLFKQQYFGELSLLDGAPRSATAVASRPTQLLALERDDFVEFIRQADRRPRCRSCTRSASASGRPTS